MNACPDWRELLIDHAAGQPAGEALEAHLKVCPDCSEALDTLRQTAADLDAAVRKLAAVEPVLYGPERVLAQIRQLRPSRPFYWRIAGAALILAVCLVVVLYRLYRPEKDLRFSAMALSNWHSPTQSLLHSPADPLLESVPHLGESFFEIKSPGDKNAR